MTRDLRAPAITPSFRTSTRSTTCGRSGRVFDRREETVRRDRAGLSGRRHARLPLPSDDRNARRPGTPFRATGRQPIDLGWRAAFPEWQPADERAMKRDCCQHCATARSRSWKTLPVRTKRRGLRRDTMKEPWIEAMQNAWRFVDEEVLRERLKDAEGIGTRPPAPRLLANSRSRPSLSPRERTSCPPSLVVAIRGLKQADPSLVDPRLTAQLGCLLDEVVIGEQKMIDAIDAVCDVARRIIGELQEGAAIGGLPSLGAAIARDPGSRPPTPAMKRFADRIAREKAVKPPPGYATTGSICRAFLDQHRPAKPTLEYLATGSKPASPAQILFAEKLSQEKGIVLSDEAKASSAAMSTWINSDQVNKRDKRRRNRVNTPTKSIAPKSTVQRKRFRKGAANVVATAIPSTPARGKSGADTALRIPYGNKDAALRTRARYRAAGGMLPPGVDLAAFGEHGWLPSPGVTGFSGTVQPLRHPRAPGLSLTGVRLVIPDHALGLPVLRALSLCTCCRHYPGAAAGRRRRSSHPAVTAFPDNVVGSACTSSFSRLARRSVALRPAHLRGHLYVTSYSEGFSHFVTSMTALVASGWSVCRVGLAPTGKRRLLTAHT